MSKTIAYKHVYTITQKNNIENMSLSDLRDYECVLGLMWDQCGENREWLRQKNFELLVEMNRRMMIYPTLSPQT